MTLFFLAAILAGILALALMGRERRESIERARYQRDCDRRRRAALVAAWEPKHEN